MSRLHARLQKLERKNIPRERVDAIVVTFVKPGENGPLGGEQEIAFIMGLPVPQVIKSLDETHEGFCSRVDKLSQQAKAIEQMSGKEMQSEIEALKKAITDANVLSESPC
jgi:hypothetical protein